MPPAYGERWGNSEYDTSQRTTAPTTKPTNFSTEPTSSSSKHCETLKCFNVNTSCSNFININLAASNKVCALLVDTGADISLLKSSIISQTELVNKTETCEITGITEQKLQTIGTISTDIICPDSVLINQKFQLIPDEFPIPTDGILGRDFLTKFRCNINYDSWILTAFYDTIEIDSISWVCAHVRTIYTHETRQRERTQHVLFLLTIKKD